jgi:hypothetical protein
LFVSPWFLDQVENGQAYFTAYLPWPPSPLDDYHASSGAPNDSRGLYSMKELGQERVEEERRRGKMSNNRCFATMGHGVSRIQLLRHCVPIELDTLAIFNHLDRQAGSFFPLLDIRM